MHPRELKTGLQKDMNKNVHCSPRWKELSGSPAEYRAMSFIHTMVHSSVMESQEPLDHATTWMSQKRPCLLPCYILLHSSNPPRAGLGYPVLGVEEDKVVIETTMETRTVFILWEKVPGLLPPRPSASASAIPLKLSGRGPVVMIVPSRIQHAGARALCDCVYI